MMTRAPFRPLRTAVIGSVILGLAAGGHLSGGGSLPEPGILAALCALTVLPVAVLTRFRLSLPVLLAVLGAGQASLHWGFGALSGGTGPGTDPVTGHAGHAHAIPETFDAAVPAAHAVGGDWQMFAAHAVATLGTALLLARGEQAFSDLVALLRPVVRLPEAVVIHPAPVLDPFFAPVVRSHDRAARRLPCRRGPPALLHAA